VDGLLREHRNNQRAFERVMRQEADKHQGKLEVIVFYYLNVLE
jgi:hypothetical protein